jgi:hypothetical protein
MERSKFDLTSVASSVPVNVIEERLGKLFHAIGDARVQRKLIAEEALIFLAIGYLGLIPSASGITIKPITGLDISELLKIPRETVRRRVARLAEMNLISVTPRGVLIDDLEEWRVLAEKVAY